MIKIRTVIKVFILTIFCYTEVFACLYNVRDIGFADFLSTPYKLYFYVSDDTPDQHISSFKKISYAAFSDCNIVVEIVNINQNEQNPALEYFSFWNIKTAPAAILVSASGRSLVLPISESDTSFNESLWTALQTVIFSRIRERILRGIIKSYCVILIVDGADEAENRRIYDLVSGAAQDVAKTMKQLPKRIDSPPQIIKISAESVPREKMLLWSLNMENAAGKEPAVVILFGRGRRFGPVLNGEEITKNRLQSFLSLIGLSCECGIDIKMAMGQQILLKWGEKEQAEVLKYLGFDAENPMVKLEMSNILSLNQTIDTRDIFGSSDGIPGNYSETKIETDNVAAISRVSPSQLRDLIASDAATSGSDKNYMLFILLMAIVVVLVFGAGGSVLLWARGKKQ